MSTALQHDHATDLEQIQARQLTITQNGVTVDWEQSGDVEIALVRGTRKTSVYMPTSAEGGYVVLGLDVDGEGWAEAITQTPAGGAVSTVDVLESAIKHLTVLRDGIRAVERAFIREAFEALDEPRQELLAEEASRLMAEQRGEDARRVAFDPAADCYAEGCSLRPVAVVDGRQACPEHGGQR